MSENNRNSEPVTVLATGDMAVLAVARSILEAAGIPHTVKHDAVQDLFRAGRIMTGLNPTGGLMEIRVMPDNARDARELLAHLVEATPDRAE
jgi:hypothetical protein